MKYEFIFLYFDFLKILSLLSNDFSSLHFHATVSTNAGVYVVGGQTEGSQTDRYLTSISRFSDDKWSQAGNLVQGRYEVGAITHGTQTMIIGGCASSCVPNDSCLATEVWNLDDGDFKIIEPRLPYCAYYQLVGTWLVDLDFCSKKLS